jgi:hypothetical protein
MALMDWPLIGAVAGVVVLAGAVTAGTVVAVRSFPEPPKKPQPFVLLLAPPPNTPGYTTASLPSNADDELAVETPKWQSSEPKSAPAQPVPNLQSPKEAPAKSNSPIRESTPNHGKASGPSRPDAIGKPTLQVSPERWRVTTTSKANYSNLGGHIDKAGIVDSMASGYLREAFKKHRNFEKLPPEMQAHINNSQNLNLAKLAPYRRLLGVNDKWLEEEQGVKFERVASNP